VGIQGDLNVGGNVNIGNGNALNFSDAVLDTNMVTMSTTATTVIDSYPINQYRSAKYFIQIEAGSGPSAMFEATEVTLLIDNNNLMYPTQFGTVTSNGELGTFDTDVVDNYVQLYFTPNSDVNTVITLIRTAVTM
jgi:hypothetical protein